MKSKETKGERIRRIRAMHRARHAARIGKTAYEQLVRTQKKEMIKPIMVKPIITVQGKKIGKLILLPLLAIPIALYAIFKYIKKRRK